MTYLKNLYKVLRIISIRDNELCFIAETYKRAVDKLKLSEDTLNVDTNGES